MKDWKQWIDLWKRTTRSAEAEKLYQEHLHEVNKDISALTEIDAGAGSALAAAYSDPGETENRSDSADSPVLRGIPFGVKDNIAVKGFSYTCGSKILEGLTAPYTASAVQRLVSAGAVPAVRTNMDEFGMGSSTENSAYCRTVNPWDSSRVPGGSSGGSAAAAAAGMVPFALGSDTGGSVRQPAAFCGIYGLKPTYGTVSRYGLAAYASSLETIGVLSPRLEMIREVYACIRGQDPHDQTSVAYPAEEKRPEVKREGYTVGVLAGNLGLTPAMQRAYDRSVEAVQELGWKVQKVDIPMLQYAMPAYYTIAMAEASANLARYTGIRYGFRENEAADPADLVRKTRTKGFGSEVKLRILMGTYVLRSGFQDQYYIRAQKIRTLLRQEIAELFCTQDLILMPVFPTQAFPFGASGLTSMQQKVADRFTLTANLAALPALSIPAGTEDNLPAGMQLMAPPFGEDRLFHAAEMMQEQLPPPPIPDQFDLESFSARLPDSDPAGKKPSQGGSADV